MFFLFYNSRLHPSDKLVYTLQGSSDDTSYQVNTQDQSVQYTMDNVSVR